MLKKWLLKLKIFKETKCLNLKKYEKETNVSILFSTQQVNDVTLAKNKS